MHRLLLLGAGKIGSAIAKFLSHTGDYDVLVGDTDPRALDRLSKSCRVETVKLDVTSQTDLRKAMAGRQTVISACSFACNPGIALAAADVGLSYFDLTEDVATTNAVRKISATAKPGQSW